MRDFTAPASGRLLPDPGKTLQWSGMAWFTVAALGQLAFVLYIAGFYGVATAAGDFARIDGRVFHGFISGDMIGNILFLSHVGLAFWITASGPLQLIPQVRNRFRLFHRWNGRFYMLVAFIISLGALVLIFRRGVVGGVPVMTGNTINAMAIMLFAALALRAARRRNFDSHRRWALRMFIAASGVWFFRLGFGFYAFITAGTLPGSKMDLTGPFDQFLGLTYSVIPLIFLELYICAQRQPSSTMKYAVAGVTFALAGATAIACFMAAQIFWLPALH